MRRTSTCCISSPSAFSGAPRRSSSKAGRPATSTGWSLRAQNVVSCEFIESAQRIVSPGFFYQGLFLIKKMFRFPSIPQALKYAKLSPNMTIHFLSSISWKLPTGSLTRCTSLFDGNAHPFAIFLIELHKGVICSSPGRFFSKISSGPWTCSTQPGPDQAAFEATIL